MLGFPPVDKVKSNNSFRLNFSIKNIGVSNLKNERPLEVILRAENGKEYVVKANVDVRRWYANETHDVSIEAGIPAGMELGKYKIFLNMPDAASTIKDRSEFSVRFANENTWEWFSGYNDLNMDIEVVSSNGIKNDLYSGSNYFSYKGLSPVAEGKVQEPPILPTEVSAYPFNETITAEQTLAKFDPATTTAGPIISVVEGIDFGSTPQVNIIQEEDSNLCIQPISNSTTEQSITFNLPNNKVLKRIKIKSIANDASINKISIETDLGEKYSWDIIPQWWTPHSTNFRNVAKTITVKIESNGVQGASNILLDNVLYEENKTVTETLDFSEFVLTEGQTIALNGKYHGLDFGTNTWKIGIKKLSDGTMQKYIYVDSENASYDGTIGLDEGTILYTFGAGLVQDAKDYKFGFGRAENNLWVWANTGSCYSPGYDEPIYSGYQSNIEVHLKGGTTNDTNATPMGVNNFMFNNLVVTRPIVNEKVTLNFNDIVMPEGETSVALSGQKDKQLQNHKEFFVLKR